MDTLLNVINRIGKFEFINFKNIKYLKNLNIETINIKFVSANPVELENFKKFTILYAPKIDEQMIQKLIKNISI